MFRRTMLLNIMDGDVQDAPRCIEIESADLEPFLWYHDSHPQIAVFTGIAWQIVPVVRGSETHPVVCAVNECRRP
jgi:hypothetical protein